METDSPGKERDRVTEYFGTGRHLNPVELRAWTSFLDAGRMLEEVLAQHLVTDHGMSHREYEILVRLDGAGGGLRMSALARMMVASAPLITQTIERLEKRGWVERHSATDDARGVEAVLTPVGVEVLAQAAGPHALIVRELLLDRVEPENLPVFAESLGSVADHLRQHRQGQPCGSDDCPVLRYP